MDKNDVYIYIRLYVASETIIIVVSENYIQLNLNKNMSFFNFRLVRKISGWPDIKVSIIDNNISQSMYLYVW